jgi:hypothetical protein
MTSSDMLLVIYIAKLMPFMVVGFAIITMVLLLILDSKTWSKLDRMTSLFVREKEELSGRLDTLLKFLETDTERIKKLEDEVFKR